MNFEILSVGTELLLGQIVNTNAQVISRFLSELGMNVYYTTVVGDNSSRLYEALRIASSRSDGVILTGGLGPTSDDITKEVVAEFCGLPCVLHEESAQHLRQWFASNQRPMPQNNMKQVMMPKGCTVLENSCGTAPGAIIEKEGTAFIMLPGPPHEMKTMLYDWVRPYLLQRTEGVIYSKTLRVFGIGESAVEERLRDLMQSCINPTLAPYAKIGEVELRLTAKAKDEKEAQALIQPTEEAVRRILGDFVYAEGEENDLQQTVVSLLRERGKTLSTAESCTGGWIAQKIVEVPGASACFPLGFVTYANEAKENIIHVPHYILEEYGAVSRETALAMCDGARKTAGTDIGVAVTGIAGPDGGSEEKPVGLVYIGLSAEGFHHAYRFCFHGDRQSIRARSAMTALDLVRRYLIGKIEEE